jgi:hypothetical protein
MPEEAKSPFEVFAAIQKRGIRLLIVGGYAVNALGYTRVTNDVDGLIIMDDLREADQMFRDAGYVLTGKEQTHARYFNPDASPNLVDVLLVNSSTFEKMWSERLPMIQEKHPFYMPRLEDIIAMKLHAVKNQGQRGSKDLVDISELLKANPGVVSKEKLVHLCHRFGPPDRIPHILEFIYGYENE